MPQQQSREISFDGPLTRSMQFRAETMNDDERTVELSFSSEEPYERYFGIEILGHGENEVRLNRLRSTGPLLFNHDRDQHIGRVVDVSIADGKGKAKVKFSNSELGQQKLQDVKDGILREVSVGYRTHAMELLKVEGGTETFRVTDWEPLEISLVTIPADTSVGVGRSTAGEPFKVIVGKSLNTSHNMSSVTTTEPPDMAKLEADIEKRTLARIESVNTAAAKLEARGFAVSSELKQKAIAQKWESGQLFEHVIANSSTEQRGADERVLHTMQRQENREFSLIRMFACIAEGRSVDGFEGEVCAEMGKLWAKSGLKPSGRVVPAAVFSRFQSAGEFSLGGATVAVNKGSLIEKLDVQPLVSRLGATQLSGLVGNVSLPRQTGGASAQWIAEGGTVNSSTATFDDVPLVPRGISISTPFSKQLLVQSSLDMEAFIRNELMLRLALEIDRAAFLGSGVSGQPKGLFTLNTATSGINTVTFSGAPTWAKVVEFESAVATDNALRGAPRFVTTPGTVGRWKTVSKDTGSGQFLIDATNRANGYEVLSTTQFVSGTHANKVIFGNFADMILAQWAGVDVVVDPYTLAKQGKIEVTMLQHVDLAYRHPESFAVSTDAGNQS